ncbi:hypothetical protein JW905_11055 [bacterium]|nr:hypothetical protein [candidate division CSSED10-310 bacterium]
MKPGGERLVMWRFEPGEYQEVVDSIAPARTSAPRIRGISLNWIALACLVAGAGIIVLMGGKGELVGPAGLVALFGAVWLPLRVLVKLAAGAERKRLMAADPVVEVASDRVVLFGKKIPWQVGKALMADLLTNATVEEQENRPWLVLDISYRSTRGSTEFQRVTTRVRVPVPAAAREEAEWTAARLRETAGAVSAGPDATA